ncbi:MAG: DedA family protein, partial [Stackebrandtia sp.]
MSIDPEPLLTSPWVYVALVALILCDVYLPVLPSGTTLGLATVYAHSGHHSVALLWLIGAGASTVGDFLAFRAVRRGSGRIRSLLARNRRIAQADARVRDMLRRRTIRTVMLARFLPAGRCLATVGCGSDPRIAWRRFQTGSALAAVAWSTYTVGVGYLNALLFHTSWL